jgi:poly(hydroxyalkanoate) depolymerase family esterase
VLLHGCRQTAAELAQGARIAPMADAIGALVLMPDQADAANPYRCWNWFDARTVAGKGEAAIVAAMIRKVRHRRRIDLRRLVVGGMSAGGALAAVVGVRYPRLVGGVFVHSGLAAGAAASDFSALSVMRRGPDNDVAAFAREARRVSRSTALVPLLVLQGNRDDVVAARNAAALARQYLAFNGVDVPPGSESTLPPADRDERDGADVRRMTRTREWQRDGLPLVRLVEMDGLGHAWCGGDATLPFNQAGPPDATALLGEWLLTAVARDRR